METKRKLFEKFIDFSIEASIGDEEEMYRKIGTTKDAYLAKKLEMIEKLLKERTEITGIP
ncbi:MAG: hypothetical protein WC165_10855 [Dysgonamonadaceae bacterium]